MASTAIGMKILQDIIPIAWDISYSLRGQIFVDLELAIAPGSVFTGLTFDGCVLHVFDPRGIVLKHCLFTDCLFMGGGWPAILARNCNRVEP